MTERSPGRKYPVGHFAERDTEIAAAHRAGASIPELMERFALSESSIYKILRRQGINLKRGPYATRNTQIVAAAATREALESIAARAGTTVDQVKRILEKASNT